MTARKKVVIVGGVAGGASAAARARRLSEESEIIVFERGPYVSFANCGLPYFIGGEIQERRKLLVQTPESLHRRLNIDVRVRSEVTKIDRERRMVTVYDHEQGREYEESYDALILSTGADPIRPPVANIDQPGVFSLRTVPDTDAIDAWLRSATRPVTSALVVGGGFIGLEMAEQFVRRGLEVTVLEAAPQILPPMDPEMAQLLLEEGERGGVTFHCGDALASFAPPTPTTGLITAKTASGREIQAGIVVMGIGVRPATALSREAGLTLGARGGVVVSETLQSSDPNIWAVGDCIEFADRVTAEVGPIPLAGPANRQGRIAADCIFGRPSRYRGHIGTAILRFFELTAASTGASEKTLRRLQREYEVVYTHSASHASYYPGAHPIALKLIFDRKTGAVLGAQAVGRDGVDKRIDVLATAIHGGMTVDDLVDLELCYAPPFGSAKDPVNIAGMVAQNVVRGEVQVVSPTRLADTPTDGVLLDVRDASEVSGGTLPGAIHIPIDELRSRLDELSRDHLYVVYCASGQRAYLACRILTQRGFRCLNLTGAYKTWRTVPPAPR